MIDYSKPRCPYCGGAGQVPVTEEYVQEQIRRDADPATVQTRLAQLRNSAHPCPACEPERYALWRDGHLEPGHSCEICKPPTPKRKARR